jgi:hypothetical protein
MKNLATDKNQIHTDKISKSHLCPSAFSSVAKTKISYPWPSVKSVVKLNFLPLLSHARGPLALGCRLEARGTTSFRFAELGYLGAFHIQASTSLRTRLRTLRLLRAWDFAAYLSGVRARSAGSRHSCTQHAPSHSKVCLADLVDRSAARCRIRDLAGAFGYGASICRQAHKHPANCVSNAISQSHARSGCRGLGLATRDHAIGCLSAGSFHPFRPFVYEVSRSACRQRCLPLLVQRRSLHQPAIRLQRSRDS